VGQTEIAGAMSDSELANMNGSLVVVCMQEFPHKKRRDKNVNPPSAARRVGFRGSRRFSDCEVAANSFSSSSGMCGCLLSWPLGDDWPKGPSPSSRYRRSFRRRLTRYWRARSHDLQLFSGRPVPRRPSSPSQRVSAWRSCVKLHHPHLHQYRCRGRLIRRVRSRVLRRMPEQCRYEVPAVREGAEKLVGCDAHEAEDHMRGFAEAVETNDAVRADDGGEGRERRCGSGGGEQGRPEAELGVVTDGGQRSRRDDDLARTTKCQSRA